MVKYDRVFELDLLQHINDDFDVICDIPGQTGWKRRPEIGNPIGVGVPLTQLYENANSIHSNMGESRKKQQPREPKKKVTSEQIAQMEAERLRKAEATATARKEADEKAKRKTEEKSMVVSLECGNNPLDGLMSVQDTTPAELVKTVTAAAYEFTKTLELGNGIDIGPSQQLSKAKTAKWHLRKKFAQPRSGPYNEVFTNYFDITFRNRSYLSCV
ncbi:hypothetical protein NX059_001138 [Plenodomus lindquistii]|nr:hypothetical protein NX059_001138 [Plenodomus lindquistii]